METLECINTRRSIRKYKDQPIDWNTIGQILYSGYCAPSGGNLQDFRFLVVTDPGAKQAIASACLEQLWIAEAPVVIIVVSEFTHSKRFYGIRGERLYAIQNCAAAAQNIMLAAHDMGLSSCWVGAFDEDRLCSTLGIPDFARPQVVLPIGFPDEEPPMPSKFKLTDIVYFNGYGSKFKNVPMDVFKDWAPTVMGFVKGTVGSVQKGGQKVSDTITGHAKKLFDKVKNKGKKE